MATLGKTTLGLSNFSIGANWASAYTITVPAFDIEVQSLVHYFNSGTAINGKGVIWDSSNNIVSISNALSIGSSAVWYTHVWTTNPILTASTSYKIGVVVSAGRQTRYTSTGGAAVGFDSGNNYTTPETLALDWTNFQPSVYINYIEAPASGPAILIEGITPAEVNTVEWANITSIK